MQEITFTYHGLEQKGIIIQENEKTLMIKLVSGYNIIVPVEDVKDRHITEHHKEASTKTRVRQDNTLPLVSILHTGGTIASKVDYSTGAVVAQFEPDELLSTYPALVKIANIQSKLVRNMMSDDMRFAHYNIMARAILDEIVSGTEGIIITHGTDTLHYTAAALSFALQGLNVPVVVVGSQRSSDRGSSDAASNIIGALTFITKLKTPGVFIAMHESTNDDSIVILDGLHARKMHSSRRDAFVPVNANAIARVKDGKVEILDEGRLAEWKSFAKIKPEVVSFDENLKISWWKSHPQSHAEELTAFVGFDGLIIEGTGLGHAPITQIDEFTTENPKIREEIGKLAAKIPVVMTTQTIFGRVNMDVYSAGRTLQELGVLGHGLDMPPEVAFIKLAWLLSQDKKKVNTQFSHNYRGEISNKSEFL